MKKLSSRGIAALIAAVLVVLLSSVILWKAAHPAPSAQAQEQTQSVRHALWAAEQELYVAAGGKEQSCIGKGALG